MAQYKAGGIDQKAVAATMLSTSKSLKDFATKFRSDFVADINAKRSSTAVVRLEPVVTLADTPADRNGLLARTAATGGYVEVGLTADRYFKVAIDELDVEPAKQAAEIGTAGGKALVKEGNANLIAGCIAQGTKQYLGANLTKSTSGDTAWGALVDLLLPFAEAQFTEDVHLFVTPMLWSRLITGQATLKSAQDPRTTAKTLLGVASVEVVPMTGAIAIAAHGAAVAQARRLIGVKTETEDFDTIVEGRIKLGTKVLATDGVQVLVEGTEPEEPEED
jgi:hypothetical protein